MIYPHSYRTTNSVTKTTSSEYGEHYAKTKLTRIKVQPELKTLLLAIDTNRPTFEQNLSEFIKVPSISGYKQYYNDIMHLQQKVKKWLSKLNIIYETFNIGHYELDGEKLKVPTVILGSLVVNKKQPTIGVYAHLDVKLTKNNDWHSKCPYKLTTRDRRFYGAGTACGKGPLLMWFHAIETFQNAKIPLPVNIKFCIESMHEWGHQNLETFIRTQELNFLRDINHWVVNESSWIGNIVPCLTYGAIGDAHFRLTAEKIKGTDTEPRTDLENIQKTLLDDNDTITIDGMNRIVDHVTPDEEVVYDQIKDFDVEDVRLSLPENKKKWDKVKLLMHFWRMPSLQISAIEECTCEKKLTLPPKVKCLLLFKIVPNQFPDIVDNLVQEHIKKVVEELQIKNTIQCKLIHGTRPWVEQIESIPYEAAKRATIQVYREVPNMIREDESISSILLLQRVFKKEILLLPLVRSDGNARKPNENMSMHCFYEGTKLLCAYMLQVECVTMKRCVGKI